MTKDLRGLDYPPMRTTWPASTTIKFSLEKANLGVSEDYFAICSYLRNNSEISGEINLKIFNEMEFITSSKNWMTLIELIIFAGVGSIIGSIIGG